MNAVLFNNEYDLLKFRLSYYKGVFDKIVLMTSDVTFAGNPKPDFQGIWTGSAIPVEVIKLDKTSLQPKDFMERWPVEYASRSQLLTYVAKENPGSVIVHTDADEFPSKSQISNLNKISLPSHGCIPLRTHYRRANWTSLGINRIWSAVSYLSSDYWLSNLAVRTHGRYISEDKVEGELGSHFSYLMMKSAEVDSKMSAFSHSEYDKGHALFSSLIPLADEYVLDHLGRGRELSMGLLHVDKVENLNSVQKAAYEFDSNWFEFSPPRRSLFSRACASIYITNQLQLHDLDEEFPSRITMRLRLVGEFFLPRVLKKVRFLRNRKSL